MRPNPNRGAAYILTHTDQFDGPAGRTQRTRRTPAGPDRGRRGADGGAAGQ